MAWIQKCSEKNWTYPNEIEMRILKGNKTWKDEETQKKICQKSRAIFLIQQHEASKIKSQRDERMTTGQWFKRSRSKRRRKSSLTPPPFTKTSAWRERERQLVRALKENEPVTYPEKLTAERPKTD